MGFSFIKGFLGGNVSKGTSRLAVLKIHDGGNSLGPKRFWDLHAYKHGPSLFKYDSILPFFHTILLWGVGYSELSMDALFLT